MLLLIDFVVIRHHLGLMASHQVHGCHSTICMLMLLLLLQHLLLVVVIVCIVIIWHILIRIGYLLIATAIQIRKYARRYRYGLRGHFTEFLLLTDTAVFGVGGCDMFLDFLLLGTGGSCDHSGCHHRRGSRVRCTMHMRARWHHTLAYIALGAYEYYIELEVGGGGEKEKY